MQLVINDEDTGHREKLINLIGRSNRMTLFSGWANKNGMMMLAQSFKAAVTRGASVTVITSEKQTKRGTRGILAQIKGLEHIVTPKEARFLHSKIYLFERGEEYSLLIGSANMMDTGLTSYEELSVEIEGVLGDDNHKQAVNYLASMMIRTTPDEVIETDSLD